MTPLDLIHGLHWPDLPATVRARAPLHLLDLIGVGAAGTRQRVSGIARDFAVAQFGGARPLMFDGRGSSLPGVALAAGLTIDGLDAHDGFNPAKGHIGCPLFAAMLGVASELDVSGEEFMTTLCIGYEFGARAAMAQHGTVADYHTSGSWGAVTAAAACTRLMRLDTGTTRHALGIAEYHGPRSQMMRCIDHPTMVKDGSGWGAMAGVSAALLAQAGFTGAPAITVEEAPGYWADLGQRWYLLEQYVKPYPVCRWAQAPIEGVLALRRAHGLTADMVDRIEVATFHESVRLATRRPTESDAAQYSTSFPCAVALVRGDVTPADIADDALDDPEVLRLSDSMVFAEDAHANAVFPGQRLAQVTLQLKDGRRLTSDWMEPRWDATAPATEAEMRAKFHALADGPLGRDRADRIDAAIDALPATPFAALADLLVQPISR
ncbi:MAG: MmgE/PrpD family protein [Limimaricola sp.]|uniref:MmgE/PrpD family protein n=1 Tax=Limimaricola sp. TaxID=2211665 RepID=UPI001E1159DA|nr:MmgE/PrpD family protein [Limimaricola sp.]MBI1418513.1 MmgE/PrpD family protein [Limimaricola sp.]